jgi:hypothetical protein
MRLAAIGFDIMNILTNFTSLIYSFLFTQLSTLDHVTQSEKYRQEGDTRWFW